MKSKVFSRSEIMRPGTGGSPPCARALFLLLVRYLLPAALLLALGITLQPVTCLQVTGENETGEEVVLWRYPLEPGEEFELVYTHSVHLTPVREVFRNDPGQGLLLVRTGFRNYGAGIADAGEREEFRREEDGFFWVDAINRPLDTVSLLLHPLPQQKLVTEGGSHDLQELAGGKSRVQLELVSLPRICLW